MTAPEWTLTKWLAWIALLVSIVAAGEIVQAEPRHGTASWYSVASCRKEGTTGVMANGKQLDDAAFTAASWDYPFGTRLRVALATSPQRNCVVTVSDRGPSRKLWYQGRKLDLSKAAFQALAPLNEGVIDVTVELLP